MRRPPARRIPTTSRLTAVTGAALVWSAACLGPDLTSRGVLPIFMMLCTAAFATVGGLLIIDGGRRAAGRALVGAALLAPLNTGAGWSFGPLPFLRGITEGMFWVALCHGVLAFQQSSLRRPDKWFLAGMWVLFVGGQLVWDIVRRPEWQGFDADAWWPVLFPDPARADAIESALGTVNLASALIFCFLVVHRATKLSRIDQYHSGPVSVAAAVSAIGAALAWSLTGRVTPVDQLLLLGVPLSFAVSVMRVRLLEAQLGAAVVALSHTPDPHTAQNSLRTVLRDDTLAVYFWVKDRELYVDLAGSPVDPRSEGTGRMRVPVSGPDEEPLAIVATDSSLRSQQAYAERTIRAMVPALVNARLQATVQAQLAALRAAQARVVDITVAERQRMERDLHDGAQQRLLAVASGIGLAGVQADHAERRETLHRAGDDLSVALRELRELAHGLYPLILRRDGLGAAVSDVACRLPVDIDVDIPAVRLDAAAEATAYFVICESLTNAAKHAGALSVRVAVQVDSETVLISVIDDGVGGADVAGQGLRGLVDRLEALGGTLQLSSPPLGGTRLTARLPHREGRPEANTT